MIQMNSDTVEQLLVSGVFIDMLDNIGHLDSFYYSAVFSFCSKCFITIFYVFNCFLNHCRCGVHHKVRGVGFSLPIHHVCRGAGAVSPRSPPRETSTPPGPLMQPPPQNTLTPSARAPPLPTAPKT